MIVVRGYGNLALSPCRPVELLLQQYQVVERRCPAGRTGTLPLFGVSVAILATLAGTSC